LTGWPGQSSARGGRVTERDLNYVEDSAELFYERDEILLKTPAGSATRAAPSASPARRPTPRTQNWTICAHSRQ